MLFQHNRPTGLGNQEPEFLIGIPNLWVEHYPAVDTESPVLVEGLTLEEIASLTSQLPENRPPAQIITEIHFSPTVIGPTEYPV